jgi:hypothetical protein
MRKALLLLLLLFYSCAEDRGREPGIFYNDIDLFSLQGKEKLTTTPALPYIEIKDNSDSERVVTYHRSKDQVRSTVYKRNADAWCTVYSERGDTSTQTVYEYLQPDEITKLYYTPPSDSQPSLLQEVVVLEKWKETSFLVEPLSIPPDVHVVGQVMPGANGTYLATITKLGGTLMIEGTKLDRKQKVTFHTKHCYEIGDQSYFRWRYLDPQVKPVSCSE